MTSYYFLNIIHSIILVKYHLCVPIYSATDHFETWNEVILTDVTLSHENKDSSKLDSEPPLLDVTNDIKSLQKRDVDFCKSFLLDAKGKSVSSCSWPYKIGLFCSEKNCPFKPSYPGTPKVRNILNGSTRNIDLVITWKEPEFGRNNLCGFQIWITRLEHNLGSTCIRINSKKIFSYVHRNVSFNTVYNVTVVSLPSYEDLDRSGRYVIFRTPGECEVYKKTDIALPWRCRLSSFVKTTKCVNGTVRAELEKIGNSPFDRFYVMVILGDRLSPVITFRRFYSKEKDFVMITGLQSGVKYVVMVFYRDDKIQQFVHSVYSTVFCKETIPTVKVLGCKNGSASVSWNAVHPTGVRYKISTMLIASNGGFVNAFFVQKNKTTITGLKHNKAYIVKVDVLLKSRNIVVGSFRSSKFTCDAGSRLLRSKSTVEDDSTIPLSIGLSTSLFIAIIIFAVVCRYTHAFRIRNNGARLRILNVDHHIPHVQMEDSNESIQKRKVIFVYARGCECINKFLLLLAFVLRRRDCEVFLDLCSNNEIMESSKERESYLMEKSREVDSVIILFAKGTKPENETALKTLVDVFVNRIMKQESKPSSFVPILVGDDLEIIEGNFRELTHAIAFANDITTSLQEFLRRIFQIEMFNVDEASENVLPVDKRMVKALHQCLGMIKNDTHHQCSSSCSKGVQQPLKPCDSFYNLSPDPDSVSNIALEELLELLKLEK